MEFDEGGWLTKQVVRIKVKHENDHDRLYPKTKTVPEYDESKYMVHGHSTHKDNIKKGSQVVPFYQTKYRGKKFKDWHKKDSGALAIVGSSIKTNKIVIIKILIPK